MKKRRKDKCNPYKLIEDAKNNIFIIAFRNSGKVDSEIMVSKEVYEVFNKSELHDISQMHEYERHIEHFILDENILYEKSKIKEVSVEEQVEYKILMEELRLSIINLPLIQKRRLIKYYFDNKTYQEIADEEHCSKIAIKYSIDLAIENISKKIKK